MSALVGFVRDRRPKQLAADVIAFALDVVDFAACLRVVVGVRVVYCEKVPCVPRRSGTHIADSCTPRSFSGGNVIGTRMMQLKMP